MVLSFENDILVMVPVLVCLTQPKALHTHQDGRGEDRTTYKGLIGLCVWVCVLMSRLYLSCRHLGPPQLDRCLLKTFLKTFQMIIFTCNMFTMVSLQGKRYFNKRLETNKNKNKTNNSIMKHFILERCTSPSTMQFRSDVLFIRLNQSGAT